MPQELEAGQDRPLHRPHRCESGGVAALAVESVVSAQNDQSAGYRSAPDAPDSPPALAVSHCDGQPDLSTFVRDPSVKASAEVLGRSFQGDASVRPLGQADHERLTAYAEALPNEPRARLLPRSD